MSRLPLTHMVTVLLVGSMIGCAPAIDKGESGEAQTTDDAGGDGAGGGSGTVPTPTITATNGQVIDPTLPGGALQLRIEVPGGAACDLEVELWTSDGAAWPLWSGTLPAGEQAAVGWDGQLDGLFAGPQRMDLAALSDCGEAGRGLALLPLAVVRLSPAELWIDAGDGAVPLSFHKADLATPREVPIDGAPYRLAGRQLDDATPQIPRWTHPQVPPWGADADPEGVDHNLPIAVVAGSDLTLRASPATEGRSGGELLPEGVRVELTSPAQGPWTGSVDGPLDPAAATAGAEVRTLTWTWSACIDEGGGCAPAAVPGARQTEHTLYRLVGPSGLRDGRAEGYASDRPFVATLAATAAAVEGAADAAGVMTGLRGYLYTDDWVIYDPGVAAYSEYDGAYITWDSITSDLSAWLDRDAGLRLYCHSMSCLLSTLGNSWGADAQQLVLGVNFRTNQTRAAHAEDWLRWSFNSHSVATIDEGELIWDASVDLDGDGEPSSTPVEPVDVVEMPIEEYLWRLSGDDIGVVNDGKCWVR